MYMYMCVCVCVCVCISSSNILVTCASRIKRALPEIFYGKPEGMGTLEIVVLDRRVILR